MNKVTFLVASAGALLSACASPAGSLDANFVTPAPQNWVSGAGDAERPMGSWLADLNDPVVAELVAEALAVNPSIKENRARVTRARTFLKEARSLRVPFANLVTSAQTTEGLDGRADTQTYTADLSVSWEADIWGRLDENTAASEFSTLAQVSDFEAVQQLIAADTARAYFLLVEAGRLVEVERANLESLEETLGFVSKQFERGLRSNEDIALISADVETSKAALEQAEQIQRQAGRALEVLLGRFPTATVNNASVLPNRPTFAAFGTPISVLDRRPDLRAAKLRALSEQARTKSAEADLLPRLTLRGSFDGSSGSIADLFDPSSLAISLLVSASQSVFDGGARRARLNRAEADLEIAVAAFQSQALLAYNDVENAIDAGQVLERREGYLMNALSEAEDALKFAKFRYELGESDLLNVLSIQQRVASLELRLVQTQRARLDQFVTLSLALGRDI